MKIEKLNENRIRITFNNAFLQENHVDAHSFMSNSIESQSLFLDMLNRAEQEVGFITDNYKLSIEALALSNETFILTVTRIEKEILKSVHVQAHRKNQICKNNMFIYRFLNFDDFYNFQNFLNISLPKIVDTLSDLNFLYQYNNYFFFVLQNINTENINAISSAISEFAISVDSSDLIFNKIKECGKLVTTDAIHKIKAM